jgi:hypothetical protein
MGYLTINTRSNRVVIISSVITRIFFNSVQSLDGYISTCFNKDTHDLFMLCIMLVCQLYCVDLLLFFNLFYCCLTFIQFCSSFVRLLFSFDSFASHCSLFKEKIQFWSWIVFQVFWSCCTIVQEVPSSSMQVKKTSYIRLHRLCLSIL